MSTNETQSPLLLCGNTSILTENLHVLQTTAVSVFSPIRISACCSSAKHIADRYIAFGCLLAHNVICSPNVLTIRQAKSFFANTLAPWSSSHTRMLCSVNDVGNQPKSINTPLTHNASVAPHQGYALCLDFRQSHAFSRS